MWESVRVGAGTRVPGLYALWRGPEIVYVGMADDDIGRRLRGHFKENFFKYTVFSWIPYDRDPDVNLRECEATAIEELDPIYNYGAPATICGS